MKTIRLLLLCLMPFIATGLCGQIVAGKTYSYKYTGTINNRYEIVMYLDFRNRPNVTGDYYYTKSGRSNSLHLSGKITSDNVLTLNEYDSYGNNTGGFSGKWSRDAFYGNFVNSKLSVMPFSLKAAAASSGSLAALFKSSVGKSYYDIIGNALLKRRLIALVGTKYYDFMVKYTQVCGPIEKENWNGCVMYHGSAAEAHNWGGNEYTIIYNQTKDCLTVEIIDDGNPSMMWQERADDAIYVKDK
jgi:hypothetical protein